MTKTGFDAFFTDVLKPMQDALEMNMQRIPAPAPASPEARLLLDHVKGPRDGVDIHNAAVRAAYRTAIMAVWKSASSYLGIPYRDRVETYGGVSCRIFTPENLRDETRKILYLHGGGYWLGSAEANASIAINMADKSGLEVISVDYRLAPEHPFPAAQTDVVTVYNALLDAGFSPGNLSIFGDSAGGGLALSSLLYLRDNDIPLPAGLGLVSPWTDLTFSGDSQISCNHYTDPWLSVEGLVPAAAAYAGDTDIRHPYVSPLFADLTGLPPLLVHVGTREILLSDATRLARNARRAGVEVHLDVFEAMWHVWHFYPCVPEATTAVTEMSDFLCQLMQAP